MSDDASFPDLIRRVRAGDQSAVGELMRRYEPAVRRAVRFRLGGAHLRRLLDTSDVCQSVFTSFFIRAALGQFQLTSPADLLKLLATMARNKVLKQAARQQAARRDRRRDEAGAAVDAADPAADPARVVAGRDLLQQVRRRLSAEELRLAEWRSQGREWADIAAEVGATPEALRKKLARGVARVAAELGLVEDDHD